MLAVVANWQKLAVTVAQSNPPPGFSWQVIGGRGGSVTVTKTAPGVAERSKVAETPSRA